MGFILTFDLTRPQSFHNIRKWLKNISEFKGSEAHKILIGNKVDLERERKVSREQAQELADEFHIQYFEVSAKTKVNLKESIEHLMRVINMSLWPSPDEQSFQLSKNRVTENEPQQKSCKC